MVCADLPVLQLQLPHSSIASPISVCCCVCIVFCLKSLALLCADARLGCGCCEPLLPWLKLLKRPQWMNTRPSLIRRRSLLLPLSLLVRPTLCDAQLSRLCCSPWLQSGSRFAAR